MRVTTGKVVDGKILVEGEPLVEGSTVTVVAHEGEQIFELAPEGEAELREAMGQIRRGESVDDDENLSNPGDD